LINKIAMDMDTDPVARGGRARSCCNSALPVSPSLAKELFENLSGRAPSTEAALGLSDLTEREEEVLRLIAWGLSNKEIAAKLNISVKTVEYHKARSAEKLHLHSRTDILRYALSQGWLQETESPE